MLARLRNQAKQEDERLKALKDQKSAEEAKANQAALQSQQS